MSKVEERAFEATTVIGGNIVQYSCDSAKFDETTNGWVLTGVSERECRWVIVPAGSSVIVCTKVPSGASKIVTPEKKIIT